MPCPKNANIREGTRVLELPSSLSCYRICLELLLFVDRSKLRDKVVDLGIITTQSIISSHRIAYHRFHAIEIKDIVLAREKELE